MKNMTFKELDDYYSRKSHNRIYCRCGHTNLIIPKADYKVCSYCGHNIYNEKGKFKIKMLNELGIENTQKYLIRETETFKGRKKDI